VATSFEVCVFGAGPAGATVASRLADRGVKVMVLDRSRRRTRWAGESLTGAIRRPLTVLGLWEKFREAGHVVGYEQRIGWGGEPWTKSSLLSSEGNLWHVDRGRFDAGLREAAQERGVPILDYRNLEDVRRLGNEWRIRIEHRVEIRSSYIVDATGRARAIARRLGARTEVYDRLIALTALMPRNKNPDFDHAMLIESTPHGWWYAAPVPRGHVLAFFTDSDLMPRELARSMRPVGANSAFVQAERDASWVAVGDACAAHDPLCGWGVCRAMSNGIRAAEAISHYVKSANASLLERYREHCRGQFEDYLKGLAKQYSNEQRWASFPFWRRRINSIA
jgi:flavin-dependent dehydrogenase